ncbi:hypothetical protein IB238_05555 [Rhizobium sp. ARZ01]|uniref:hypothetical protein n=1 Tax=Rhizobium sp. ARZ01 TaxID=2769313 RepID=UPI0017858589|nr:hypothetical protein [Rhizobium sp. ARZ01]MBD9372095.1 hypothetical protein [Rhizobium sp. ARZ01]
MMRAPVQKIPYAGKERPGAYIPPGPIGLRGVALLRRVRAADGPYRCERNADAIAWRCIEAGMVRLDSRDDDVLHLTEKGRAYLDRLMRAL